MNNVNLPHRKRNRLEFYDYSTNGAYFVTICTQGRKNTLCSIVGDGFPVPKLPFSIAEHYIRQIPIRFPSVAIDRYVIMPNHIHLLLMLHCTNGTGDPSPTLSAVIGWYKYQVTKDVNRALHLPGCKFFQRSFHDHIIRAEKDYQRIWEYIDSNPRRWNEDCFFCD